MGIGLDFFGGAASTSIKRVTNWADTDKRLQVTVVPMVDQINLPLFERFCNWALIKQSAGVVCCTVRTCVKSSLTSSHFLASMVALYSRPLR